MKMNVPQEEAKQYVEKVKERQMGYLFENMEKIDIQKERRKTAKERRQREQAERQAEQAERQAEEAQKQMKEERDNSIKAVVLLCQEFGAAKEDTVKHVMEKCGLTQEEAHRCVDAYWK